MKRFLGHYAEYIYAIMRIVVGFLFLCHGVQKVLGFMGHERIPLGSLGGVAGIIELVCGTLIAIGLLTSWAGFLASGLMAFAYFIAHFPKGFLPIENGGELAAVYSFVFLYMAARGSGIWSVASASGNPELS